jgi:hypothetical protein
MWDSSTASRLFSPQLPRRNEHRGHFPPDFQLGPGSAHSIRPGRFRPDLGGGTSLRVLCVSGVYPPQASIKPPHPSLSVIDLRRPDHQALLRWIDAEDPAPAAAGSSNITDRLLNVTYQPSYATMRTSPLAVPETPPTVLFPPARDPLAIIRSVETKPAPLPPPDVAKLTRVVFSSSWPAGSRMRSRRSPSRPKHPRLWTRQSS